MKKTGYDEAVARYYEAIFPVNPVTVAFLKAQAGPAPEPVLDLACGIGGYSVAMAREGYFVDAVDLDENMIHHANKKVDAAQLSGKVHLYLENMLQIDRLGLPPSRLIWCIGNSLVHLHEPMQGNDFLSKLAHQLLPGGKLVLQIVNYDRVVLEKARGLPTIQSPENRLRFERHYEPILTDQECVDELQKDKPFLFRSKLLVEDSVYESRVTLLALQSRTLIQWLEEAGFMDVTCYGSFAGERYDEKTSPALIIVTKVPVAKW